MSEPEVWKTISAAPNYAISNLGRIMRLTNGNGGAKAGNILKLKTRKDGYLGIRFYKCGEFMVHRLVAIAFLGEPPTPEHEAAHNDGDRGNPRLSNLRWATKLENTADRRKHGTNGNLLTENDVREIRKSSESGPALAARYGVHYNTIYAVKSGASWNWCP